MSIQKLFLGISVLRRYTHTPTPRYILFLFALCALHFAPSPAHAAANIVTLSNIDIPYETIAFPNGTTISYTLDATGGTVQVDIHRLTSATELASVANLVAGIQFPNEAPSTTRTFFWNALWLIGGDIGRQNGSYRVRVTQGAATYVVPSMIQINSVDIHNVSVSPSFDANNSPAFPYLIRYSLAKGSLVTVEITDSAGDHVRTLAADASQLGEDTVPVHTLSWNGLNSNARPVALGVYTVTVRAQDASTNDLAIPRTRSIAVQSLANLETDIQKIFDQNTFVYPNPVRNGQATFQAMAVRNNANISVKIYTLAGDLVREENFRDLITAQVVTFNWNAENQAGKKVGRGLYYVAVKQDDPEGSVHTVKKVAVIP